MLSYLNYSAIKTDIFPDSYSMSRQQLLGLIDLFSVGVIKHDVYPCPGETPVGEALYTDAVWLGPENAAKVLILLAGTHGVEGFLGSAVGFDHLNLLASRQIVLPSDMAILFVHALTPWGYAWLRRCDLEGVDLNRNGIDFSKSLPANPIYDSFRKALFLADLEQIAVIFKDFEREHGRNLLEIAISGGQYTDPTWPFYGGSKPAHGRLVTEELMSRYNLAARNLAVIDLHSGLGPYGYGEIICDHSPNSPGTQMAHCWYGDAVTLPALGTSSSVPKVGLMDYSWHELMNPQSCHVTLEFGTYPTDRLFQVLLRDHQLWSQKNNDAARQEHSILMRQHFCPTDKAWQAMVLFRARQVIAQAIQGLSG